MLLYSSVNDNIAHIAVQIRHNDRFSNCVLLLYGLYILYCRGRLEEVQKVGCSYTICIDNKNFVKKETILQLQTFVFLY